MEMLASCLHLAGRPCLERGLRELPTSCARCDRRCVKGWAQEQATSRLEFFEAFHIAASHVNLNVVESGCIFTGGMNVRPCGC